MTGGLRGTADRRNRWAILPLLLLALVGGCSRNPAVECSSPQAQEPLLTIVKEQIERLVTAQVRTGGGSPIPARIRAAIGQLSFSVADIRTTTADPNSTRRFCLGSLRMRVPTEMIADADQARQVSSLPSVSEMADSSDVQRSENTFSAPIEFNVQPTDDGASVFAETDTRNRLFSFGGTLLGSALLRSAVEESQRQSRLADEQRVAAESAAQGEQRAATLQAARADDQLATQGINAVWGALGPAIRRQLLGVQRAWIREKDAGCRVESASVSVDPSEIEAARLSCDARQTRGRITWLEQYRSSDVARPVEDTSPPPDQDPKTELP